MMIEKMEPRQSDFCQLVGLLTLYLESTRKMARPGSGSS